MNVAVYDHVHPADADYTGGVYRVVGIADDRVTLLRVTDADGTRTSTGHLERVPREDLVGFESASDPDAGFAPVRTLLGALEGYAAMIRNRFSG